MTPFNDDTPELYRIRSSRELAHDRDEDSYYPASWEPCPRCHGHGVVESEVYGSLTCPRCGGYGEIRQ